MYRDNQMIQDVEEYAAMKEREAFIKAEEAEIKRVIEQRDDLLVKVRNLEFFHENQRLIITALLDRMRAVRFTMSEDEIAKLIADSAWLGLPQQNRLEDPSE